jgi:hypothetical protein
VETGLIVGAAYGSSTSRKDGTGFDVSVGGTSFSTGAPQTPRDNDSDDEEPLLDEVTIIIALKG